MPHINDPLMQAYVDGVCNDARVREIEEHLAACASCRERFEQARGAATRASELLAALDPGPVHAPAFAELQARAARAAGKATSQGSAADRVPAATSPAATDFDRGAAGAGPGHLASGAPELDLSVFATPRKRGRAPLWRSPALAWAATVVIAFLLGWLSRTEIIVPGATPAGSLDGFARAPSQSATEPAAQAPVAGAELDDAVAKSTASGDPADETATGMASEAGAQSAAGPVDERREMEQSLGRQGVAEAQRRVAATNPTVADPAATDPAAANAAAAADPRARAADAVAEPAAPQPLAPAEEVAQAGAAPLIAEGNEAFADAAMPIASSTAPGFVTIHRDAVAAFLGAQPRTLPGMALVRAEVAAGGQVPGGLADRFAVRTIYLAPNGQEIALLQQYVGALEGQESAAPGAMAPERAAASAGARAERPAAAGDYVFRADRDMAGGLEAALDALDLPATSREPDGRVTHRWRAGDFVLAISAMLDADVVRGLADQVR